MAPTRELAVQVANEFQKVAPQLRTEAMYGGKAYATQQRALRDGVDVVVGTPGRLVDLMTRGDLEFANTQCVVLDEADRMLDIGFADEMDQILEAVQSSQPAGKRSQVCLFSATLPTWIQKATRKFMTKERVSVDLIGDEEIKTSESVQHLRMRINAKARARVIQDLVMLYGRTIIFVETKIEAEHLGQSLPDTAALHGDITQQGREAAFAKFKSGQLTALVATDVAARGLDVPDVCDGRWLRNQTV
jgi:ATP-dependent RNA helicase DDX21